MVNLWSKHHDPTNKNKLKDEAQISVKTKGSNELDKFRSRRRELEEIILKLTVLEKECIDVKIQDKKEELQDNFIVLKQTLYKELNKIASLIHLRNEERRQNGNSVTVIQQGIQLNHKFSEIDSMLSLLKASFKSQTKKKKVSNDKLDERFNDLQHINQNIEQLRNLFQSETDVSQSTMKTLTDIVNNFNKDNSGTPVVTNTAWRERSQKEQEVLDRWAQKDADIDRQVAEIGSVVDNLMQNALEIQEKAEAQATVLAELNNRADEVGNNLRSVNDSINTIMKNQSGLNIAFKLLLVFILVLLLSYIIPTLRSRIIG
ncbi:uncharacterized protein LOC128884342 isoform X2 [Hylaeus volcanicus]|uniref:uncharacterized protein LOC128884342 isoform X2 n=1 Tax=Hylaeus volcanicus TaxID=313075 RepID=UPI0023B87596|nr:uncharacterized protein LOC128884342 isoform X2 [Hylaeus volcanicus]